MKKNFCIYLASMISITVFISACATTNSSNLNSEQTVNLQSLKDKSLLVVQKADIKNVQLSMPKMPIPLTTAMKTNGYGPLSVKSIDGSGFEVTDVRITFSKEALSKEQELVSEYIAYYQVKKNVIKSLNIKTAKGEFDFLKFIDSISEKDMYCIEDGDSIPPDISKFATLRSREVYLFVIKDSKNETYPVQIYIETTKDSNELK